ncbi:hypothetical protein FJT64_020727 [Amphibalanus amphitrite]|uniref:Uncharacterized protein n=1 Tax=Amphibalanus amphitrite TaxID=1232801 RepID=A0A6A4WWF9_AMPAM|nr:hypothetical protein FJT64_020727 [Amphibalanus amphitrite]
MTDGRTEGYRTDGRLHDRRQDGKICRTKGRASMNDSPGSVDGARQADNDGDDGGEDVSIDSGVGGGDGGGGGGTGFHPHLVWSVWLGREYSRLAAVADRTGSRWPKANCAA